MLWGAWFRRKPFLTTEDEAWHLEMWRWMLCHFGGRDTLRRTRLVKPTSAFFPATDTSGHARAEYVFRIVKNLAGISDWPCELIAQPDSPPMFVGENAVLNVDENRAPLGTFLTNGKGVQITYEPSIVTNPATMVTVFAHELSHYMLASIAEPTPGGEMLREYATDLMTVFIGFGALCANQTFSFRRFRRGWQTTGQGYLAERDWLFGLAVFAALREESVSEMKDPLKPYLYTDLLKAERYLKANPALLAKALDPKIGSSA